MIIGPVLEDRAALSLRLAICIDRIILKMKFNIIFLQKN